MKFSRLVMTSVIVLASLLASSCSCSRKDDGASDETSSQEAGDEEKDASIMSDKWEKINPEDLSMQPVKAFNKDWFALTVEASRNVNAMTISWGTIGELWNKPVVIVYVSSSRASKRMMDRASTFTISAFPESFRNRESLAYIGSHSFDDEPEKIKNSGLTLEKTPEGALTYKQASLVLQCKKIYSDDFKKNLMPSEIVKIYDNLGLHTFYIGEIISVWKRPEEGQ